MDEEAYASVDNEANSRLWKKADCSLERRIMLDEL